MSNPLHRQFISASRRRLALVAFLALSSVGLDRAAAEPVWFTAHGTTYHARVGCKVLARRVAPPLTADRAVATAHGLKPCRSCYGQHRANNRDWAKEGK